MQHKVPGRQNQGLCQCQCQSTARKLNVWRNVVNFNLPDPEGGCNSHKISRPNGINQQRRSCFDFFATAKHTHTHTHTQHYPHSNQPEDSRSHPQHPIVSDCGRSDVENVGVGEDEAHLKDPTLGLISSQAHRSNESRWSQSRGSVMRKLQHQIDTTNANTRSTLGFLIILSYLSRLC